MEIKGTGLADFDEVNYEERIFNDDNEDDVVVTLEQHVQNRIRQLIESDDDQIVNIWGEGAVGKSTMISRVCNKQFLTDLGLEICLWINAKEFQDFSGSADSFDVKQFFTQVAEWLGIQLDQHFQRKTLGLMKQKIQEFIEEKFNGNALLIADDVFDRRVFNTCKDLFPKVIVISRENFVPRNPNNHVEIIGMNDETAEKLALKILFGSDELADSTKRRRILDKIILYSNGLPLIVQILCDRLNTDSSEWFRDLGFNYSQLVSQCIPEHPDQHYQEQDSEMWKMLLVDFDTCEPEDRLAFYAFLVMGEAQEVSIEELAILWTGPQFHPMTNFSSTKCIAEQFVKCSYIRRVVGSGQSSGSSYLVNAFLHETALRYLCLYESSDCCLFLTDHLEQYRKDFDKQRENIVTSIRWHWLTNIGLATTNENVIHLAAEKKAVKLMEIAVECLANQADHFQSMLVQASMPKKETPMNVLARQILKAKSSQNHRDLAFFVKTTCHLAQLAKLYCNLPLTFSNRNKTTVEAGEALLQTANVKDAKCNALFVCVNLYFYVFEILLDQLPPKPIFDLTTIVDENGNTLLHAAQDALVPILKKLLAREIDTSVRNKFGRTALMAHAGSHISEQLLASEGDDDDDDDVDVEAAEPSPLKLILDACSDEVVNAEDLNGDTALDIATKHLLFENVGLLMERCDPDGNHEDNLKRFQQKLASRSSAAASSLCKQFGIPYFKPCQFIFDEDKFDDFKASLEAVEQVKSQKMANSLLLVSCLAGNLSTAQYLMEHFKPNVNCRTTLDGSTPLLLAVAGNDVEMCKFLLAQQGIDSDQSDEQGTTPLLAAVIEGHEEIWKLLIEHGCDVNKVHLQFGSTPLVLACMDGGRTNFVEYVCSSLPAGRCDLTRPFRNQTPFQWAMETNHFESAHAIAKALANQMKAKGQSEEAKEQLELATKAKELELERVRLTIGFIESGKFKEFKSILQDNPVNEARAGRLLLASCRRNKVKFAHYILENFEPNVNCFNSSTGQTPLLIAVANKNVDLCRLLVQQEGIDLDQCDFKGISPLFLAVMENCEGIWRLLLENGADVNKIDATLGCTPLVVSCMKGRSKFIEIACSMPMVDLSMKCSHLTPFQWAIKFEQFELAFLIANELAKRAKNEVMKVGQAEDFEKMASMALDLAEQQLVANTSETGQQCRVQ